MKLPVSFEPDQALLPATQRGDPCRSWRTFPLQRRSSHSSLLRRNSQQNSLNTPPLPPRRTSVMRSMHCCDTSVSIAHLFGNFYCIVHPALRSCEEVPTYEGASRVINVIFVCVDSLDYRSRASKALAIFRVSRCTCCPICYRGLVGRCCHIVYLYPPLLPYAHAFLHDGSSHGMLYLVFLRWICICVLCPR